RDLASKDAGERRAGADALVRVQGVTGDAGTKHLDAVIAGESGERILGRAHHDVADRLAGHRVPTADHAVAAPGQQRAPIREKRSRPDGQSRSGGGALDLAPKSVENRTRAADAGGGDEAAIARQGPRAER